MLLGVQKYIGPSFSGESFHILDGLYVTNVVLERDYQALKLEIESSPCDKKIWSEHQTLFVTQVHVRGSGPEANTKPYI